VEQSLEQRVQEIGEKVDQLIEAIKADEQISDEELKHINDLVQMIEDKITAALADHGLEIGDERVD